MIVPSPIFLKAALVATLMTLGAVFGSGVPAWLFALPGLLLLLISLWDGTMALFSPRPQVEGLIDDQVFVAEHGQLEFRLSARNGEPWQPRATPQNLRKFVPKAALAGNPLIRFTVPEGLLCDEELPVQAGLSVTDFQAVKRGSWGIDTVWIVWTSPLGLFDVSAKRDVGLTTACVPNIRTIQSGEVTLQVRDALFGAKTMATRGSGTEFHQLSEFSYGMDARAIDWKQSAKHRALHVKERQAETNHQIIIAIDHGHLAREELDHVSRLDHNIHAALALTWAALMAEDQVGLFLFADRPSLYLPPQGGRRTFAQIRSRVADVALQDAQTNHVLGLSTLQSALARRSLVVVLSDFSDPLSAELLVDYLAGLQRRHLVVFVSLRPVDLHQTARHRARSMDDVSAAVSADALLKERAAIFGKMRRLGIDVIECDPGDALTQIVNAYLDVKARARL
ncbi:MAG: DUF58 domain-containing protein [Pseudomonadota bacterium]